MHRAKVNFNLVIGSESKRTIKEIERYTTDNPERKPEDDLRKALDMILEKDEEHPDQQKHNFEVVLSSVAFAYLRVHKAFWQQLAQQVQAGQPFLPSLSLFFPPGEEASRLSLDSHVICSLLLLDPEIYGELDPRSQCQPTVVAAYLKAFPLGVTLLQKTLQQQYPRLVCDALAKLPLSEKIVRSNCSRKLETSLWSNKDVVLKWVQSGGKRHRKIPDEIWNESEVTGALKSKRTTPTTPTTRISEKLELPGDKTIILEIVRENPACFLQICKDKSKNPLFVDCDVTIAALSNVCGLSLYYTIEEAGRKDWTEIASVVKEKLKTTNISKGDRIAELTAARRTLELMGIHWLDQSS